MGSKLVGIRYIFTEVICEFHGDPEIAEAYGGDVDAWAEAHISQPVFRSPTLEKVERFKIDEPIGTKDGWLRRIDRKTGRVEFGK